MKKYKYIIGLKDNDRNYYAITSLTGEIDKSLIPLKRRIMVDVPAIYSYPFNTFIRDASFDYKKYSWALFKVQVEFDYNNFEQYDNSLPIYNNVKVSWIDEIFYPFSFAHFILKEEFEYGSYEIAAEARRKMLTEQVHFIMSIGEEFNSYLAILNYEYEGQGPGKHLPNDFVFPLTRYNLLRYPNALRNHLTIDYSLLNTKGQFGFEGAIPQYYTDTFSDEDYVFLIKNSCTDLLNHQDDERLANKHFVEELLKHGLDECFGRILLGMYPRQLNSFGGDFLLESTLSQFEYYLKDFDESKIDKAKLDDKNTWEEKVKYEKDLLCKILPYITEKSLTLINERFDLEKVKEISYNK